MKKNIIRILFVFLISVLFTCTYDKNDQDVSSDDSNNQNDNKIKVQNLEILDTLNSEINVPDDNDPRWKPASIPLIYKLPEPFYEDHRCVWLRGDFIIDDSDKFQPDDIYAINSGLVFASECVLVNGQSVGAFRFDKEKTFKLWMPRSYVFPGNIKFQKNNKLHIGYFINRKYVTLISGIVIQDKINYENKENWNNLLYIQVPMALAILLLGLFIVILRIYFHLRIKRFLIYSLFIINSCICLLAPHLPAHIINFPILMTFIYVLLAADIILIILIFQSFYGKYFFRQNLVIAFIILLVSVYMFIRFLITSDFNIDNQPLKYFPVALMIYLIYIIYRMNRLKPDRFNFKICISFLFVLVAVITVFLFTLKYNIWHQFFYTNYSTPLYAIPIIIYEARESKKRRLEFQEVYQILKKNNNGSSLTGSAEQKMERVVAFINENYCSGISREGLASAVDMNPNYMSQLFNVHTGNKLNDYINGLRVKDAADQLVNTNDGKKIQDIAQAVGFEKVGTFNRIFKDIMGCSPGEYRKKNI